MRAHVSACGIGNHDSNGKNPFQEMFAFLLIARQSKNQFIVSTMGRSQVLYNRTKARIRAGRGGGGTSTGRGETGDPRSSSNHPSNHRYLHENTASQSNDDDSTAAPSSVSSSWRKPKRYLDKGRDADSVHAGDQDHTEVNQEEESYGYNEADVANFENARPICSWTCSPPKRTRTLVPPTLRTKE
jgi:hypothetical protein